MSNMVERLECLELHKKIMPVEEAVKFIHDGATLAISGFTKSGEPKSFLPALGKYFAAEAPHSRITLLSGASLSEVVEDPVAPFIAKRAPYMSSPESRKRILDKSMDFNDIHLSHFSRNLMYGFYGEIDFAVVEVSRVKPDGGVVLTSSVGISGEALTKAKKIILEVNTTGPDYTGFHDMTQPRVYPRVGWPVPVTNVGDRVGSLHVPIDLRKVVAVVESKIPDYGVSFKATSEMDRKIADNVVDFLVTCQKRYNWGPKIPPLQSGVGNIANAIVGSLYESNFKRLRFWTEVFQDGMLRYLDNDEKFDVASATAVSFSNEGWKSFLNNFDRARDKIILRPTWLSNSPEIISRLFVVAMNTPIEVDIYGHANSTHLDGSKIVNGLGGSGDFLRNAYISIMHTPSIRRLKDGRVVSCVMPYVRHIDHTEHDIKCIVTEQGVVLNTEILSPSRRAQLMIEKCAHPHFRPLLMEYLRMAGSGDEPRIENMDRLKDWWKEYDEACRHFPN
ncbi:MAG TPA: acetyl-CoA hydrolase/transferase C-terminal domain-containing protein [Pseudobdellovibrionaceae bacterium]|nr:acetyl-CoA hydrolase/transferase C-terminal domain-containing protein [Pseudobdellovibrionaceae bacterium]